MAAARLFAATLIACAGLVTPGLVTPALAEDGAGVAIRQNSLSLAWPTRPTGLGLPDGVAGVSQTQVRTWYSQNWLGATFTGAVELSTGFGTLGSGGLGLMGGGSSSNSRPFEVVPLLWQSATPSLGSAAARVDRLDAAWRMGPVEFDLGRQPVSLGTSHFVGVLDVLSPLAPGSLDGTYKPGIDALRTRMELGSTGEAEVILAGNDPLNAGGALGRVRTNLGGMDLEVLGGHFRNRGFGGLGWEGDLGFCGFWGELAGFQRRPDVEQVRGGTSQAAVSGVIGTDFLLPWDTRLGTALMYQDFGARSAQELASVRLDAPYQEGWTFLGSAGYGVVTLSHQFAPLVTGSLFGIFNLVDGSELWQPRLTLSISDNADLGVYGWLGFGSVPQAQGAGWSAGSEFGLTPTGVGVYARWFF